MKKERFYFTQGVKLGNLEVLVNDNGDIVAAGGLSFKSNIPRVTICGIYDDEANTMTYGVARCSHKDVFIKKKGRELAFDRALNKPYDIVRIGKKKVSDVFMENARRIEEEVLSQMYPIKLSKY